MKNLCDGCVMANLAARYCEGCARMPWKLERAEGIAVNDLYKQPGEDEREA